jgi:hypothetical protein
MTLRPYITVPVDPRRPIEECRVLHLCEIAHRECYRANSLGTEVRVIPVVTLSGTAQ